MSIINYLKRLKWIFEASLRKGRLYERLSEIKCEDIFGLLLSKCAIW